MRRPAVSLALVLIAIAAALTFRFAVTGPAAAKADARIAYGSDRLQHADLWLPKGSGPFPVALLIHGGCWLSAPGAADGLDALARDLRGRGIAVWNVEYRGTNQAPFPATLDDVAAGADALRDAARRYPIDLERVAAVGHSAGGHLALWLAARRGIAPASPLHNADPLPLAAAISLGGPPDLEADLKALAACGPDAIARLVGSASGARRDVFADTSPARLGQPAVPVTLISGSKDQAVPPAFAEAYGLRVGGTPRHIVVEGADHSALIAPGSEAWHRAAAMIEASLRR